MWGGGILKNNNIVSSKNNDGLDFCKNSKNTKTSNFFAFSLIELSIVLIIIGLLVAGITGGASLIESAKIRAFINEISSFKQAVHTFYASKDRLPGDLNNLGTIGYNSGQTYTTSSFSEPYNAKTPNTDSAPFIDLYLEKIIDFKPSETNPTGGAGKGYPYSKVFKTGTFRFWNFKSKGSSGNYLFNIKIDSPYVYFSDNTANERKKYPKIFKKVDEKLDDGQYDSAIMNAICAAPNATPSKSSGFALYDEAINDNTGGYCSGFNFNIGF